MNNLAASIDALSPKKRELFRLLREKQQVQAPVPAIIRRPQSGSRPLSFAQQRLWFLDQWQPGTSLYNLAGGLRLIGTLDVTALENSLSEILSRHEALRTTFPTIDGKPVQHITPAASFNLKIIDLSTLAPDEREGAARKLAKEEYGQPFDLVEGPLFRARLLRLHKRDHMLLMTMHHIVSDGWSSGVFTHELSVLYKSFIEHKPSPLPELPIQYSDFAQWQHESLHGDVLANQLAYWKKQLAGAPEVLGLPLDHPRSAMQTFAGRREAFLLPEKLTEALRALSRQNGVTLFMTLLAAFQVLLSRYSGQTDIVVGSPVAGRTTPETEKLIGLFVNTLAFRSDLSGNPTFLDLLAQVREMTLNAYAHQDLPFEKLVEELHPTRDLSRPPLFQVMFVLQNLDGQRLDLPGLETQSIESDTDTAKFDLSLYMWEAAAHVHGQFEYNTDLFDLTTIRRMMGHFTMLLENIVAEPTVPLSRVAIMSSSEREQVVVEWNQTASDYPSDLCLHQLFEKQVELTPNAVAVVFEKEQLTYRELNERAGKLARQLKKMGAGPEVLVGLCVERGIAMIVGLLGILKAGSAYVPLDPNYPEARLSLMLEDAAIAVLLTETSVLSRLPSQHSAYVVCLDTNFTSEKAVDTTSDSTTQSLNQLAYVIYTSGSTGKPKGVMVEHKSLVNFICAMRQLTNIGPTDTLLAVTTLGFDIAGLEMFLPLSAGARLVIASRESVLDGSALIDILDRERVTIMQATPVTWRMLIDSGWEGDDRLLALCGGEPLGRDLANQLVSRTGTLWNLYGPTETTIWSTATKISDGNGPVLIGRPIANTQIYLLDQNAQPVPVGVPGEIHIGGDGVARGYLHRDALTRERFIPDPFNRNEAARIYRTGDLGRYLPNGEIEFFGRLDRQVKVRGHRIEPGEIENALKQCAGVSEAVVVASNEGGEMRLVAYLIAVATVNDDELRSQLQLQLPDYMVPSVFVKLQELPLTPNGKLDRNSLPSPPSERPQLTASYTPPRSELEQNIAAIWQNTLRIEKAGRDDTFFDLGGHSLLMAQVRNALIQELGVEISIVDLFRYPTIASLADYLDTRELIPRSNYIQHRAGTRLQSLRTNLRQRQR